MLQMRSNSRDAYGGSPVVWMDVAKVRFMILTESGRELDNAGNLRSVAVTTITMRFIPNVVPGMRIKTDPTKLDDGRFFNITVVNDVNLKHYELELTALEDRTASP